MTFRWSCVLVLFVWFSCQGQLQGCDFTYTDQPPMGLECNPYENGVLLRCAVDGPVDTQFSIEWYQMGLSDDQAVIVVGDTQVMSGSVRSTRLLIQAGDLSGNGDAFWCQIRVYGQLLRKSSTLYVTVENWYNNVKNFEDCSFTQSLADTTNPLCVNLTVQPIVTPTSYLRIAPHAAPPIATTAMPTSTSEGSSDGGSGLQTALYAVITIIAVFCIAIVTLAIAIVVLYRRKVRRMDVKVAAPNPYSGISRDMISSRSVTPNDPPSSRSPSQPHSRSLSQPPSRPPSQPHSRPPSFRSGHLPPKASEEDMYSQLGAHDIPPPLPPHYPTNEYSKLGPQSIAPPPRPPKPQLLRAMSNPNDRSFPQPDPPPTNIYRTLEPSPPVSGKRDSATGHYYHVLEDLNPHKTETFERWPKAEVGLLTQKSLFDDPNYFPVKLARHEATNPGYTEQEVTDPRYTGDYERDPNYVPPTAVKIPSDPKYRGDYERDPNYIPKPPPRRRVSEGKLPRRRKLSDVTRKVMVEVHPPKPPKRRQSLGAADHHELSKYRGDYERDPSYVPPPFWNENMGTGPDSKYRGDYERDPSYVPPPFRNENMGTGPDSKYRGNYERDPNYVPPPFWNENMGTGPDSKYRGDYERDPNYVPPPFRNENMGTGPDSKYRGDYERDPNYVPPPLKVGTRLDNKYRGDYERDPIYMADLVRRAAEMTTSAEYSYPYPVTDDVVPPHVPHEYKALVEVMKDPPGEYARLKSEPPDTPTTTLSSTNTTV